jgi:hypothetical protein
MSKITRREQEMHTALWSLINSIDAIAEIHQGHPHYRIDLATAIKCALNEADLYSKMFPAEGKWRPRYVV